MNRISFAACLAATITLSACQRPDAILFANFEDDTVGALPDTSPAGSPNDEIIFIPNAQSLTGAQVVGAPNFALGSGDLEAAINAENTKSFMIPASVQGTSGAWFLSEQIPFQSRSERHSVTLDGFLAGTSASFTLMQNNLQFFGLVTVSPTQVTVTPDAEDAITLPAAIGTGAYQLRMTVEPATQTFTATVRFAGGEVTHSGAYAPSRQLNRLILTVAPAGDGGTGAIIVDNIQATPPLDISIGPAG